MSSDTTTSAAPYREDPREERIKELEKKLKAKDDIIENRDYIIKDNNERHSRIVEELRGRRDRAEGVYIVNWFKAVLYALAICIWLVLSVVVIVAPLLAVYFQHARAEWMLLAIPGVISGIFWLTLNRPGT